MSSIFELAESIWLDEMNSQSGRYWQKRLAAGDLGLSHYKGFLIETYHNAGLNPQLQAYASLYIRGRPRDTFKKFFQHAISEIGHDLLALADLEIVGVPSEEVLASRPLPETSAFFANAVYNIQRRGAVSYLAYLFHLEYTPTKNGPQIMALLSSKGVPASAMTFLEEHSTVDFNHLKLMKGYMDNIVTNDEEKIVFSECLHDTIVLHHRMLEAAFENGEKKFE